MWPVHTAGMQRPPDSESPRDVLNVLARGCVEPATRNKRHVGRRSRGAKLGALVAVARQQGQPVGACGAEHCSGSALGTRRILVPRRIDKLEIPQHSVPVAHTAGCSSRPECGTGCWACSLRGFPAVCVLGRLRNVAVTDCFPCGKHAVTAIDDVGCGCCSVCAAPACWCRA